jgi:hypothetical protein
VASELPGHLHDKRVHSPQAQCPSDVGSPIRAKRVLLDEVNSAKAPYICVNAGGEGLRSGPSAYGSGNLDGDGEGLNGIVLTAADLLQEAPACRVSRLLPPQRRDEDPTVDREEHADYFSLCSLISSTASAPVQRLEISSLASI